jgi:hypothetical protein
MRLLLPVLVLLGLPACGEEPPAPQATETAALQTPAVADDPAPPAQTPVAQPAAPAVSLKYLMGDIDPASDPMFAKIPAKYLGGSRTYGRKDAVAALVKMADAAAKDGVSLKAVSAFRSFSDQKKIWEDKWTGKTKVEGGQLPKTVPDPAKRARKILEFSSMPGTSRHHWGTDFDLNSLQNGYFAKGAGKKTYDWLVAHASEYGFCQVYSKKGDKRPTGYEEEKWHWSYLPVASQYLKAYPTVMGYEHLTGFLGSEQAKAIDTIPNYVQGINPDCKK